MSVYLRSWILWNEWECENDG